MQAVRLHGPRDLRLETLPHPGPPGPGQALLRIEVTGVCGSDLHSFQDARIGDTPVASPLVLGHEFSAIVEAAGDKARDGQFEPLRPGTLVAVDPAQPCHQCEPCEHGHPNLCANLRFCSNHPHGGSLCQWMLMPGRCCFPVPASIDADGAALLEPLGVAIHTVDLAHLRVGHSVAILGAGSIGLLILQVARLAGADPIFVADPLPWRLRRAESLGAVAAPGDAAAIAAFVQRQTHGRGVDVAVEAAWADHSVETAAALTRLGGRVVLVGIPGDDRLALRHSTARRKGLTLVLCRRMKHTYPRAIALAARRRVQLTELISHRFALDQAPAAFDLNARYSDDVVKVMIRS
jgi:L-iditol 2-dehydrogenase